jgi:hypothetical protein
MEDNVQTEGNQPKKKLLHVSLIKVLIVEELRRLGKNWDSFLLIADIPRDPKGDSFSPTGKVTSHHVEEEIGRVAEEGKKLESPSPQQSIPRKKGKTRKNEETGEAQVLNEPCAKSAPEYLLMRAIWLEPIEGPSRETCDRRRRTNIEGMVIREPSQQLEKDKLAIVELCQENRELRHQLAANTLKASTSHVREGNMNWLKKQLRESQDTIIQLCEAQRMSEERNSKHFKKC